MAVGGFTRPAPALDPGGARRENPPEARVPMSEAGRGYRWFVLGDWNGFFGLMFDNLTVMSFLAGILVFAFGYPADIVYGRMFPGTALGVLFGDLVYSYMAFRLARKTGKDNVTAMPLGLDTP